MSFALEREAKNKVADSKSLTPAKPSSTRHRASNLARGFDDSLLHLQPTIGNQTVLPKSDGLEVVSNATASGHFGHDFSQIPVFPTDAATRPAASPAPGVISHRERSVEMPGEEEQTVDGGTPAPGAPATAGCDCVPSSVQIKNVSPYRSGKLYGHKFDVEVALTYFAAASGPGTDAQLFWFERTDRPPAWQGILKPNVWNDMFALFPTSPTFHGWTKNRTKPCPGNETATIHDPPARERRPPCQNFGVRHLRTRTTDQPQCASQTSSRA